MFLILRIAIALLLAATSLHAADRPNILWITSEDNAFHWLGCYGNTQVKTPRLDALAHEGVRFEYAYSNAPVCAVARSTILTGAYATTTGTQHMRSRYPIPAAYKPHASYLRKLGYYCTNNDKTDYNIKGNDKAPWDECSRKAHYNHRPEGAPFFHIVNLYISHESSLFPQKIKSLYKGEVKPRIAPADVIVPPYLPDLPEIRRDLAIYHDTMEKLDTQVGQVLDELDKAGLADDTIVFYYSDHGGILPRGKRYLNDTGSRVPMIVRVPEKWKHLSPFKNGNSTDETVSFVDLAPTLLSLVGLETPPQMQGRAFLGKHRREPADGDNIYLFADRFDSILSGMQRGITTGRWKYIRTFTPHLAAAPRSQYQFGQAGWKGWRKAWQDGKLKSEFNALWESPRATEQLYDTTADPWEIHNLAGKPEHAEQLNAMRGQLRQRMIDTRDTSIIPEAMFASLAGDQPVADYLATRNDLPALVDLAFIASSADPTTLDALTAKLDAPDPLTRYWATHGLVVLGKTAAPASIDFDAIEKEPEAAIRIATAHSYHRKGHHSLALTPLLNELKKPLPEAAMLAALNALHHIGAYDKIPADRLNSLLKDYRNTYVERFIQDCRHP